MLRPLLPLALAALAASVLLTAGPPGAWAQAPQVPCQLALALCPDLIVDPVKMRGASITTRTFSANSCNVQEGHVPGPGTYRLLQFTFTTPNIGTADLVVGSPSQHPEWFVFHPCHNHYHFREYADYRLWTPAGYAEWAALRTATSAAIQSKDLLAMMPDLQDKFVAGNKQGFCVIDLVDYTFGGLPANWRSCGNQGISIGWADEYHRSLDGQWIVVSGLAPGDYMLEAEVNAERLYAELDYVNNSVAVPVKVT